MILSRGRLGVTGSSRRQDRHRWRNPEVAIHRLPTGVARDPARSTRRVVFLPAEPSAAAERDRHGAPQVELIGVQAVMPQLGVTSPVMLPEASTPSP
jgi:hypothetical protein